MRACWTCRATQPDENRYCSQRGASLGHLAAGSAVAARPPQLPPVRYPRTAAGLRLAYALTGEGEDTLIVVPGLVTHLTFDWQVPEIRAFYEGLGRRGRLLRYDRIGGGLGAADSGRLIRRGRAVRGLRSRAPRTA